MTTNISNNDDVIDSRDIEERIEELESMLTSFTCNSCNQEVEFDPETEEEKGHADDCITDCDSDDCGLVVEEREELHELWVLRSEVEGYSEWKYGVALIRDSYFEEYAEELASELGLMKERDSWPYTCIDWKQAAEELQQDYTYVNFGSETYWYLCT